MNSSGKKIMTGFGSGDQLWLKNNDQHLGATS
jgi:hypothetical protein